MSRVGHAGTEIHVEQRGEGHPLILLHGLGGHSGWLADDIGRLSRVRRVIAPDARGHGRSARPPAFTLRDHLNDVLGVMDALGIAQADVMGTSMGSYVAQALATTVPERVSRLILVVPKAGGRVSGTAALMAAHADALRDLSPQEAQAYLLNLMFAPSTPQATRDSVTRLAAQDAEQGLAQSPAEAEAARRALEHFDFTPDLPRVSAPTLILSGRHDPLNPPPAGAEIAALIPDARQVVMEHSGHMPAVEEPARYAGLVDAFLRD